MAGEVLSKAYQELLEDLKQRIRTARVRAALMVNRELVLLYWQIGQTILHRQAKEGWGARVIDRLAEDLRQDFPDMRGFSPRNLKYMRAFAEAYSDEQFVQQVAALIPWFHNCVILEKVKDPALREWYARACIEHGWSRAVLEAQIETRLHERTGRAITNFSRTLPAPQSELAQQILKDPYNFDFLTTHDAAVERDLHKGLLEHLKDFMLELGVGFAFVGSNYHLEVGGEDFYLDLLFYHVKLRCFVVVELKTTEFKPEYAGKLNFYLSAADDLLRHPQDNPTIGILLCKGKSHVIVEYALRDVHKPMGVAEYQLAKALPEHLKGSLPTVEQLEAELKAVEERERKPVDEAGYGG
ncbi:MAG: PDDEXK nuclease domain-containing protein [Bacillota bacterium]|nr:PDDEXK nuclease domain-containing protein [Bacillota bacterium]